MFPCFNCGFINNFPNCAVIIGMKEMFLRWWFLIALSIAVLHQVLQKILNIQIQVVNSYLDPLLFLPILLQLMLFERRYLFEKDAQYVFSWYQILMVVFVVSMVCEVLFPLWNPAFTADYIDAICYLIGGVIFGVFFNTTSESGLIPILPIVKF